MLSVGLLFSVLCIFGGIYWNINPKDQSTNSITSPCGTLSKSSAYLDTRDRRRAIQYLAQDVSEIITSTYGASQMGYFKDNSYTTCSWDTKGATELTINYIANNVTVCRKYATVDSAKPYPNVTGEVWTITESIDERNYPKAYLAVKTLFANHNPAND